RSRPPRRRRRRTRPRRTRCLVRPPATRGPTRRPAPAAPLRAHGDGWVVCAPQGLRRDSVDPEQFFTASGVIIVAGKGGVGKTAVTATMAVAASSVGLRTLVVEVEGKAGLAAMFDSEDLAYEQQELVPPGAAPGGGGRGGGGAAGGRGGGEGRGGGGGRLGGPRLRGGGAGPRRRRPRRGGGAVAHARRRADRLPAGARDAPPREPADRERRARHR